MKWRVAVDRAVGPLGLTHAQYSLLASLYGMTRDGQQPSQRQLADQLCLISGAATISRNEISRWERGVRLPAQAWLGWLTVVLGTSLPAPSPLAPLRSSWTTSIILERILSL
jgi:transcriptional regulator with XRE-family HTH domain